MSDSNREETIFASVLALPASARGAYLDSACAEDGGLRRRVEELIEAHESGGRFMEEPAAPAPCEVEPANSAPSERPGDRIGRYKLLEQIGEGGCGVVYVAEQEEPVRRRVALKIIKLGMDTKQVIARFSAERQALAMMEHPNIARIFDAGVTDAPARLAGEPENRRSFDSPEARFAPTPSHLTAGRPYFVMELVRGIKITAYCDQHELSTRERLDLFIQVCRAIQHAHQKGIIHRDIKPSNILVTVNDGVAVPKVIDFGIAKATQGRLTDQTVYTAFEQFIGTPAYMSPEQAEMTSLDIDTRSDIYSLGVLLYELLTGQTPFDANKLLAAGLDEMRRTIREVEPVKPSTRLTLEQVIDVGKRGAKEQSRNRKSQIDPDLDWIVMKCLEKDRKRRYETANGLASDIERHLRQEAVRARPPSATYQFQKWVRRHKFGFAASVVVAVAAAAALVILVASDLQIRTARRAELLERQKSTAANRELHSTVRMLELQRAEDFFRAGDPGLGVAHLAAILRREPTNHIAASRLVSALVHRNWAIPAAAPMRHQERVPMVAFSPDGRHVLSASWDKTAQIWDTATARPIAILPHTDRVVAAFYNGDGSRCVTASHDGTARVWNATNGAPLAVLHHNGKVLWAEFSPDGRRAVTAGADKCARVWDSQTGELILELRGHATEVVVATFSPDGQRIATGCESGSIRVWDAKTGLSIHQLVHGVGAAGAINSLVFSPDGRRLASASLDRTARLWNPGTGAPIREPITHTDHVNHVAFSPDSRLLLTTCHDGSARLWDAGTGLPFGAPLQHKGGVVFGAFSPDGTTIVTTAMDNSARLWNVQTGAALCAPMRAPEAIIYAAFSPDGQRLLTSSWDRTVQLWDIQPRRNDGMQSQWHHDLTSVQFSPNGKFLLLTCYRVAQVIDHETGQPVCDPLHHTDIVSAANFSPDSERIVTGLLDGEAQIWDWRMARLIGRPLRHEKRIRSVHFNQDGTRVLTSSDDATARVWDAQTGLPVTPPLRHADQVWAAQFSPDGRLVVTASDDHTARVWDALTGAPLNEPLQHWDQLGWAEFSPDGLRVATASLDNTACIWDARTGKRLVPPIQHTRTVHRARFSPDGTELVTASMDLTAGIWDARTGQALRAPLQHDHPLSDASFSSDGQRIFTAEEDSGRGRLWDAQSGMPLTEWLEAGGWIHYNACLDRSGSYFAMGGQKGVLRIWHLPPVPIPVPLWFVSFAEAVARIRLTTHGGLEVVPLSEFEAVFEHVGSQETRGFYEHAASWFLADPAQRPADPFSQARGKPAAWLASVSNLTRTTDAANLALLNEKLTSEPGNIDLWKAKAILLEQTNALAQTCEVYSKILQLLPAMERPGATQRAELLLKRASALRQLNRFTEAAADNLAARGIPGPSEGICPRQIDLSAYYNATLDEDWTDKKDPVNKGNRLSNLPHGLLSLDGIDFDIRGIVQLSSRIQKGLDDSYPPKVEQIKVGQRCHKVHFLHGTSWRVREGMYIGSYVVHWQDGRQEEIAIEYGADLREWWNGHRPATAAGRATLAWTGKTPTGQIAGVYHRSWTNPRPEEPIDHLDFISNMTDCAPFLIALTVE